MKNIINEHFKNCETNQDRIDFNQNEIPSEIFEFGTQSWHQ